MSQRFLIYIAYSMLFFGWIIFTSESIDPSDKSSNAPFDGFCIACHSPSTLEGAISITGIPPIIEAGAVYAVTLSITATTDSAINAGFQMVSVFENNFMNAGDFQAIGNDVGTANAGMREYIEHRIAKNFNNKEANWTFNWQAPSGPDGAVIEMFYAGVIGDGFGVDGDNSKSGSTFFTLSVPTPTLVATISNQTDIQCHGQNTGSATISAENGPRPYRYAWSNGSNSATIQNLSAGAYFVTVTDNNGDTATAMAIITEPDPIAISTTSTDVKCHGENSGIISVTVSGGAGAYTYQWSNGSSEGILTVGAGDHKVTVSDGNGCLLMDSVTVDQPPPLEIEISKIDETSNMANDGIASVVAMGGIGPYQYAWSTTADSSGVVGLSPGIYSVTVTDHNFCTQVDLVSIEAFGCSLDAVIESRNLNCQGDSSGFAKVVIEEASEPVNYEWSNGHTTDSINELAHGVYNVTITDKNNCQSILSVSIQEPTLLGGSIVPIDPICPVDSSGSLTVLPVGGTGPYSYTWSSGGTNASELNLNAGDYQVTILDAKSCAAILSGSLRAQDTIPPSALAATSTVYLDSSGLVQVSEGMLDLLSSDNCAIDSFWVDQAHFNCEHLDTQLLQLLVADAAGNQDQTLIEVLVKDTIAPIFENCLIDITADSGAILTYRIPVAIDNCGVDSLVLIEGQESGTVFPVGETMVTFRAVDPSGNASHCSFFVNVEGMATSTIDLEFSRNIIIFPNPSIDKLHLDFRQKVRKPISIEIYDSKGSPINKEVVGDVNDLIEIDATLWPPGMFLVRVEQGGRVAIRKVIRQ